MEGLLLASFSRFCRDLPWRRTTDPYAILVSEIMLQQTQVDRVIPRYLAWLERWPTAEALAAASAADVIRAWQGLGYNRRALALHRAAQMIAADGWPSDLTDAPRRRAVHGSSDPQLRPRRERAPARRQRRPRRASHGPQLHRCRRAGAHGSRSDDLPRPDPPLRRLSAAVRVPLPRNPRRAGPQAEPIRGVVPPASGRDPPARRGSCDDRGCSRSGGRGRLSRRTGSSSSSGTEPSPFPRSNAEFILL